MNASWMIASTIVAILLAGAALALARVTALYRGPALRWIWASAALASVVVALLWLRSPTPPATSPAAAPLASPASPSAPLPAPGAAPLAPRVNAARITLPNLPPSFDRMLAIGWALGSTLLLVLLAATSARLRAERRGWVRGEVANTPVLISRSFGPAIVGVHSPAIVLPEWVLALDEDAQRLIVAHEMEHRAARDPALILGGLAVVILMPWNIGAWLIWRGLRRAIELDCDARVIARGVDDSAYASVLLGAWQSAQSSWLPSTAFAERASGLGARVEHLMRPEPRRRVMRTLAGAVVASGLVFVACMAPSPQRSTPSAGGPYPLVIIDGVKRPDLPPRFRFVGPVVVETTTTPTFRIVYKGEQVEDSTTRKLYPSMSDGTMMQMIDAPASVKHFGEDAKYGALLYYTRKYRDAGGAMIAPTEGNVSVRASDPATPVGEMAQRIYDRMFQGITLPPDRAARALQVIETEFAAQRGVRGPILVSWNTRITLNAQRDAELRAMLNSDAERERFDVRSLEGRPRPVTVDLIAQSMYTNLFRNPSTPADVKSRAVAIITASLYDDAAAYRRNPDALDERLAIRARRDATLRPLLLTEEERVMFDKIAARTRDAEIKP